MGVDGRTSNQRSGPRSGSTGLIQDPVRRSAPLDRRRELDQITLYEAGKPCRDFYSEVGSTSRIFSASTCAATAAPYGVQCPAYSRARSV
jgi:hypothetical protein